MIDNKVTGMKFKISGQSGVHRVWKLKDALDYA